MAGEPGDAERSRHIGGGDAAELQHDEVDDSVDMDGDVRVSVAVGMGIEGVVGGNGVLGLAMYSADTTGVSQAVKQGRIPTRSMSASMARCWP
jgi:hypothetical protein